MQQIKCDVKFFKSYCFLLLFWCVGFLSFAQQERLDSRASNNTAVFTIRGSVYEKESYTPYKNVEIVVNGGRYTRTFADGSFNLEVKIGDELIIIQ